MGELISRVFVLMSTGRAIQVSVVHTIAGIGIGSLIEGVLPAYAEGASLTTLAFEALVQVGLNGAALAVASGLLRENDPTYGIPFSLALAEAQPQLGDRLQALGAVAKAEVARVVQRTVPRAAVV